MISVTRTDVESDGLAEAEQRLAGVIHAIIEERTAAEPFPPERELWEALTGSGPAERRRGA